LNRELGKGYVNINKSSLTPLKRMRQNRNTAFTYEDQVVEAIASRCTEVESGARNIDHILSHTLLPEMSRELLSRMVDGGEIEEVKVKVGDEGFVYEVS